MIKNTTAFPTAPIVRDVNNSTIEHWGEDGMALRDYFAAHAPSVPQPWFVPEISLDRPQAESRDPDTHRYRHKLSPTREEEVVRRFFGEERRTGREVADEFNISRQLLYRILKRHPELVRELTKTPLPHKVDQDLYQQEYNRQRCIQWPYAWAAEMLVEREKEFAEDPYAAVKEFARWIGTQMKEWPDGDAGSVFREVAAQLEGFTGIKPEAGGA